MFLGDEAGGIEANVGLTDGRDHPFAATFRGAERDEEDLVLVPVDQASQSAFKIDLLRRREVALKHRELEVQPVILAGLEDFSQALGVADVVSDNVVGAAHGSPPCSAGGEWQVALNLACQCSRKQAELEFDGASVADFVVEKRMGDRIAHPFLISLKESPPSQRGEIHGVSRLYEIGGTQHARVDGAQHCGVGNEGTKLLHHVQCERGPAVARAVIQSDVGIEAHGQRRHCAVAGEQTVGEGEERVDGIPGRPSVAGLEVESEKGLGPELSLGFIVLETRDFVVVVAGLDHAVKIPEVHQCRRALDSEQRGVAGGGQRRALGVLERPQGQGRRLDMVAHEERALIADLSVDEEAGKNQ